MNAEKGLFGRSMLTRGATVFWSVVVYLFNTSPSYSVISVALYVAKRVQKGFASGRFFWGCCAAAPEKYRRREIDCAPAHRRRHRA
jgi:hypothetical protein